MTSTGNVDIDPTVPDSGFGGTSEGPYQLRLDFRPRVDNFLVDATATAFDGDADGDPGGVYSFWFRSVPVAQHVYVDKGAPAVFPNGQGGTRPADGSLQRPFNNLLAAQNDVQHRVQSGEVLRIVGNGGSDGDLSTLKDNLAYELGIANGRILADGAGLIVPQGVTVMVDAGAIFKLLKGNIQVGSSSATVDRSGSVLQILGTPGSNAIFTSYDDRDIGANSNPRPGQKEPGDWGGIIFQNDIDRAEGASTTSRQASSSTTWGRRTCAMAEATSRSMRCSRREPDSHDRCAPDHSVQHDLLQRGRCPLANPDSFLETNFHAVDALDVDYQLQSFTPDYDRIGPDLAEITSQIIASTGSLFGSARPPEIACGG